MVRRGLHHISELTNLEDVNLSDTAITDQGMIAFAPLKGMQRLNLSYTGAPHTARHCFPYPPPARLAVHHSIMHRKQTTYQIELAG